MRQGKLSSRTLSINYGRLFNLTFDGVEDPATCWAPDDTPPTFRQFPTVDITNNYRGFAWVNEASTAFCVANAYWGGHLLYGLTGTVMGGVLSSPEIYGPFVDTSHETAANITIRRIGDEGLSPIMERIALSLSKLALDMDAPHQVVTGFKFWPETLVRVRWWWLTLPVALGLAGAAMLVRVMVATRRSGVQLWKSSVAAVLYHGLEERVERPDRDLVSDMEVDAESTRVRLRKSENGKGVALIG